MINVIITLFYTDCNEIKRKGAIIIKPNKFYDLLLTPLETPEERNQASHEFIEAVGDEYDTRMSEDLALWILYGAKEVTVKTQIALGGYKCERA